MAVTFTIQPNPHWVIIDDFSKLPNGAAIYTFSNRNPSLFKPAFQNQTGLEFGQPIVGFGNGTFPPIYWKFDSDQPLEGYFIKVYSAPIELGGVLLWTFNNLFGGGSGGGGTIITNNDIENLVVNGQFFSHIEDQVGAPSIDTLITLAPSNHAQFVGYDNDPPNTGPVGPDIIFAKSGSTATDSMKFIKFAQGDDLLGDNPNPEFYVEYNCVIAGSDQYRYVQFPIVKGLQNLSGETVAVKIWSNFQSGNATALTMSLRQFFGNGGAPDLDVQIPLGTLTVDPGNWTESIFSNVLIPSIAGKSLGTCGNDALYLQLHLAPSNLIHVQFILPALFLDDEITPSDFIDFNTLDQVEAITNNPRTGDIRTSLNAFSPYGWVNMNDGTIGAETSQATTRKNVDTFTLYDLIWRTFKSINEPFAPMFAPGGVPTAYGVNSFTDFNNNNVISLTRNLGRVMAGALPVQVTQAFTTPVANVITIGSTAAFKATGVPVTVLGSTVPTLVNNTTYYARILSLTTMSLHRSAEGAIANTGIVLFPANGALGGTVVLASHPLGKFLGEETHVMITDELVAHVHGVGGGGQFIATGAGGNNYGDGAFTTSNQPQTLANVQPGGVQLPFNVMQPTVFMNVFIKL